MVYIHFFNYYLFRATDGGVGDIRVYCPKPMVEGGPELSKLGPLQPLHYWLEQFSKIGLVEENR